MLLSAASIAVDTDDDADDDGDVDDDGGGGEARVVSGCSWDCCRVKSLSSLLVTIIYCSAGASE